MVTFAVPTGGVIVRGPKQGQWTVDDWEALDHSDGNRYEVIDGILYVQASSANLEEAGYTTTAPSSFHQWIISRLFKFVGFPAEEKGLAFSYTAPIGVLMPDANPIQPDFVIVRKERADIISDRRIRGVPDVIIEVMSPGSRAYDTELKREAYEKARVPEYAIVDPEARTLMLYRLTDDAYGETQVYEVDAVVSFAALPDIELLVGALFEGAPDTTL